MTNYSTTTRYSLFIRLTQIFASARSKNYKIIIRAHYIGGEPNDFSIVEQDIQQWIPFLANNTDVLYVVQAGWLGIAFGEWWGTIVLNCTRSNHLFNSFPSTLLLPKLTFNIHIQCVISISYKGSSTTPDLDDGSNPLISYKKSFIVSSLLDLPDNIPISLRSPRDISNYFHGLNRIGFHNDCLLSDGPDGSDTGTYDKSSLFWATGDIKEARSYSMNQIRSLRGGESCPGVYSDTMPCSAILTLVQVNRSK